MADRISQPAGVAPATDLPAARRATWHYLALALGVVGIAWAAIFVKWAQVPGVASAFYRLLIATAILLPWQAAGLRRRAAGGADARRALWWAVIAGIFFALDLAFWNTGLLFTSAASATLLTNTAPVFVGLGTLFLFRERLSGWFWIGLATALAGAVLILGHDLLHPAGGSTLGLGDLLSLGASVFYAAYLLVTARVRATLDTFTVMAVGSAAGAVVMLAASLAMGAPLAGYAFHQWLALLGLGLISHLGGALLINYALGHLPAAVVSVSLLGQPVLVALLGVVLLGEALGPFQALGGVLVIGGIFIVHRLGR